MNSEKLKNSAIKMFKETTMENGVEPIFVSCGVVFNKENKVENMTIKLSTDIIPQEDDDIFFYCQDLGEFLELCDKDNGQDFVVVDIYDMFNEL